MIFAPFTGKDNHGKCVTFGVAIIFHEDDESYSWVSQKFVDCMGSHPNVLITDQDPALKKAVQIVLPNMSHKFCMWHILKKLVEKLPMSLRGDAEFKIKFESIAWSKLDEAAAFEEKWHQLINEYGLANNRWFSDMFESRSFWIPTFFRDT